MALTVLVSVAGHAFISLLAVPLSTWAGIFLSDMIFHKRYDSDSLLNLQADSPYWYWHGVNLPAIISWLAGIVVGFLFVTA